jgi:hypothetical protein
MNEARNGGHFCADPVPSDRARLESLLRVALEQWPFKSEADREHERRLIERDLARLEAH